MRIEGISETTDADLVTKVVAGDPAAFAHLVRRHAPMAKRMAVFWGAGADSDDVVQEAFVKAYAALPRFRSDGEFRPWLLRIVRNETRNLFRGRSRRAAREEAAQRPTRPARPAIRRMPLSAPVGASSCWPPYGDWPSRCEKW